MRNGNWSGLPGVVEEDFAVSVSAGPIRDRSKEMLVGSDVAIAQLYRSLLSHADNPDKVMDVPWDSLRGIQAVLQPGQNWRELVFQSEVHG